MISAEQTKCAYLLTCNAMLRNSGPPSIHGPVCYSASIPTIPKNRSGKTADISCY